MKTWCSNAWQGLWLGLLLAPVALAEPVGEPEAVAAAEWWYAREINASTTGLPPAVKEQRLANRAKHQVQYLAGRDDLRAAPQTGRAPLAYVVTFDPTGFVIVSGEDSLQPVLAFNVTGEFKWAGPEKDYASRFLGRCVAKAATQLRALAVKSQPQPVHTNWTRLRQELQSPISTKESPGPQESQGIYVLWPTALWSQDNHYNETCVAHNGGTNVPTGCTATAMAIQMRFHEWPPSGHGSHSYYDEWGVTRFNHSADFGSHTYNWSAMPTNSLTADNTNVADLMYDCGVAVNMDYEEGGSGAWPSGAAMNTYFRYRGTYEENSSTPSDHVAAMAYSVRSGLPTVFFSSVHTMLACGYRDSVAPYFYINLGWGGVNNGWYDLDSLPVSDATIDRSYPYGAPESYVYVDCDTPLLDGMQHGTLVAPYKTVGKGQTNVSSGGVLMVKAGLYTGPGNAPLILSQPMTIKAYLGPATVGP